MSEKQMVRKDVGVAKKFEAKGYINNHTDINDVIDFFTNAKEAGATHVDWLAEADYDHDSDYCEAQPFYQVEETDKELEARVKKAEYDKEYRFHQNLREELAQYERLKAKFGA